MSTGHRGAAYGPRAIRSDERILPNAPQMLINPSTRVKPFEELTVVDYGDAAVDPFSIDNSMEPIRALVPEIAQTGAIPIVLGGDHSILWPDTAAVADVYGAGKVGVIHFDAHPDCSNDLFGHLADRRPTRTARTARVRRRSALAQRLSCQSRCSSSTIAWSTSDIRSMVWRTWRRSVTDTGTWWKSGPHACCTASTTA